MKKTPPPHELVEMLGRYGIVLKLEDGAFIASAARPETGPAARQRRWRAKKKAKLLAAHLQTIYKPSTNHLQGEWRGITWRDVPGRDEAARKMRFSLLKRGDWTGYKSCQYLAGEALKAAFSKITESQKAKSALAATQRTADAKTRNQSPP